MSEQIKITVVLENGKSNNMSDDSGQKSVVLTHDPSLTIMSDLLKAHLINGSFCGGRGDCGRCRIRFLKGATIPTPLERSALDAEELRLGYRLACLAKPKDDCVIELACADAERIDVVTDMIAVTDNIDQSSQNKSQTEKQRSLVTERDADAPGESAVESVIAVDLGTTTIAMQLAELASGRILDTWCEMNPQRRYGADVLSRIRASCEGAREDLQRIVTEVLERGVARFQSRGTKIQGMCIAGNTTMQQLLTGQDVSGLGRSPFTPAVSGLQSYSHADWDFPVWITPVISAFVGGDIVAGLYACGLLPGMEDGLPETSRPDGSGQTNAGRQGGKHDGGRTVYFLIDLGTNGEMAATDGARMITTATAAGPAFEGGAGAGIVGSDMVACTAALLDAGIADGNGLLAEPYFTEGVALRRTASGAYMPVLADPVSDRPADGAADALDAPLRVTQTDIRAVQMAKAAVRAGVEILYEKLGRPARVQVYLAGGFGYYLDTEAALRIGLLPEHMRGSVKAVGNTSLRGAYLIGRDLALHRTDGASLEQSLSAIESLNLAEQEDFEELYIRYMEFDSVKSAQNSHMEKR